MNNDAIQTRDMLGDGPDWEPEPHERQWFAHADSGDMGWLVRRDGKDFIRLDRGATDHLVEYRPARWVPKADHKRLTDYQMAEVAFEADRRFLRATGRIPEARLEWRDLRDEKRRDWMHRGPNEAGPRKMLYDAIVSVLKTVGEP